MSLSKFIRNNHGVAAVEFALLMPILLLLFLSGFELTRYVLLNQKLSKTAASMSDLISRLPSVTEFEVQNSFNAVQHLMSPYHEPEGTKVIITSVINDAGTVRVNWQRCGGGSFAVTSAIGAEGELATLPAGFTLEDKEDTIIAEIFYNFVPILAPETVGPGVLSITRFTRPRLGALVEIPDDQGITGCT